MRTKYFVNQHDRKPYILWRENNGLMGFSIKDNVGWRFTNVSYPFHKKYLTAKQARKLFPAAFKTKTNLNPRPKKLKPLVHIQVPAVVPVNIVGLKSQAPKSEAQKVEEFKNEFLNHSENHIKVVTPFMGIINFKEPTESKWRRFWRNCREFLLDNDNASNRLFPLIK